MPLILPYLCLSRRPQCNMVLRVTPLEEHARHAPRTYTLTQTTHNGAENKKTLELSLVIASIGVSSIRSASIHAIAVFLSHSRSFLFPVKLRQKITRLLHPMHPSVWLGSCTRHPSNMTHELLCTHHSTTQPLNPPVAPKKVCQH